ncbi:MAG: 5-formyltetrahydrofolate cyclo-ligase [Pelagibacteraceae bacterium TMED216]|nr:MAG: 5-formyltetrahydrofolate cyclo-ligase [Pelagibacteraceae bacterium TMED216]|tara:strand:- start:13848 stop:14384 length:537 start_codon:yes stop_codon:yes gene_type:complete
MQSKKILRKKFFKLRKNKYFDISNNFFKPLIPILKKKTKINLAIYYPSNYEVNILKIFISNNKRENITYLLPKINGKNEMKFYRWKKNDPLGVNNFGLLEPTSSKEYVPQLMMIPLLAFDKDFYRLGYGKGYYDRYLKKYQNIFTIGVAFSFQKYNKLPISNFDIKLNQILTEKGFEK